MPTARSSVRSNTPLSAQQLRWRCEPSDVESAPTARTVAEERTIGQRRSLDAIAFGLAVEQGGFNVFVVGPIGSGRTSTARELVNRRAADRSPAPDWCYVHNFEEPSAPLAVQLPTGRGPELARDLDELIAGCRREIPRIFEGEHYQQHRADLMQQVQGQREQLLEQLRAEAHRVNFDVELSPMGIASIPLLEPGKPLTPEAFELLPDAKKAEIRANGQQVARAAEEMLGIVRGIERQARERMQALDREVMSFAVGHLLDTLRSKYRDMPSVLRHLDDIQSDLVGHVEELQAVESETTQSPELAQIKDRAYERYRANVLVANSSQDGAPVVVESNPTYYNLLGRMDYRAAMGGMQTDFRMIRSGALHRANGGYLLLQARDVLVSPFAWDALKRALRDREVRIENLGEQVTPIPTATLKPMPIPLSVKVILIGDQ
jgi:LonB-like, AAA domain/Lon-like LonC helical domain